MEDPDFETQGGPAEGSTQVLDLDEDNAALAQFGIVTQVV
jgi:hypothetical protein